MSRVTNALANLKQCLSNFEPLLPVPLEGAVKSSGTVLEKDVLDIFDENGCSRCPLCFLLQKKTD